MTPEERASRALYEQLQPGDTVEVIHGVTVGSHVICRRCGAPIAAGASHGPWCPATEEPHRCAP